MLSTRHQIGFLAVVTVLASVGVWIYAGSNTDVPEVQGALLKVGLTLGAVWLAYPQLSKLPIWLAVITVGSILVILIFRKAAIVLIPLLIVVWLLRPKPARRRAPATRSNRKSSTSGR